MTFEYKMVINYQDLELHKRIYFDEILGTAHYRKKGVTLYHGTNLFIISCCTWKTFKNVVDWVNGYLNE